MPKPSSHPRTLVRVISLESAMDRRARFERRAEESTLAWSYLWGLTAAHPDLVYDEDKAIVAWGRPLFPGEIGCYSSHYQAWQEFLAGDHDQLIVLEDDVIVDWHALAILAGTDFRPWDVDYLCFFNMRPIPYRRIGPSPIRFGSLTELRGDAWGTSAYLLSRRAAQIFSGHCRTLCRPIDNELSRTYDHGIPQLALFPQTTLHEEGESSIGDARRAHFSIPAHLRTARLLSRLRGYLMRKMQPITRRGLAPRRPRRQVPAASLEQVQAKSVSPL